MPGTWYAKLQSIILLVLTRDIHKAKAWLKAQAHGSERYGIVVSSKGFRPDRWRWM